MLNTRNFTTRSSNEELDCFDEEAPSDDDCAPKEFMNNALCPAILLTKEGKRILRKPWRNSIINMFNGKIGYMGLMRRLKKKWSLKGDLTLTDIGCKYYIARFTNNADYHHVLT